MKFFKASFLVLTLVASVTVHAQGVPAQVDPKDDPRGPMPMHEAQVRKMLAGQGLDTEVIDQVVRQLKQVPGAAAQGDLQLAGALTTSGGNGAFFVDNDNWNFDGTFLANGKLVHIPKVFDGYYWDGGFKTSLEYKWIWIFLPKGTTLSSLDGRTFGGKIFGRGLALGSNFHPNSPVYIEGGWVTDSQGMGNAFILSMAAGFTSFDWSSGEAETHVGKRVFKRWVSLPLMVNFPKIIFTQKVLLPSGY